VHGVLSNKIIRKEPSSFQRQFLSQIHHSALRQMDYWDRLSFLRVYSQERRRGRYQICFLLKLTQGLIKGYSITWQWSDRRGRLAVPTTIPRNANSSVKGAREKSLSVRSTPLLMLERLTSTSRC
jgi:hypothetical protein